MNYLFLITLITVSSFSWAAKDWKTIAETTTCDEKIQILGKDGEKYVLAVHGNEKTKLFSTDGSLFNENSMSSTDFISPKGSEVSYLFKQPSYVEANPPKIEVTYKDNKKRCKMNLSR